MKVLKLKRKLGALKCLSLVLLLIMALSVFVNSFNALLTDNIDTETPQTNTVDTSSNSYKNIVNEKNIGQIWTDKSVFNKDIPINEEKVVSKEDDEDFLVSLSALSVGIDLNIKEGNVKDIVILQDLTRSMVNSHVASSSGSITRLQASKNAINELLSIIAKANDSLSSDDEKFRVALLSFAGKGAERVHFNLTEVRSSNLGGLQSAVNAMTVSSTTYITPGLNLSLTQIQTYGRKNVDSAIIAFLDGEPDEESDGESAVATARILKNNYKIIMYSIIVNDDAQGGTGTTIDRIGQGMSSNYDYATSTSNLGTKTGNTYYYIPKTADDMLNSFKNIIKTIQKKDYTLEKNSKLTFTDKLGDYMEVNKIKALYYNGDIYTKVDELPKDEAIETEENTELDVEEDESFKKEPITYTYTFTNTVVDSFGKSTNTNVIDIKVTKSKKIEEGDTITVIIPYNLVPKVTYDVTSTFLTDRTVYTTKLEDALPISVIYSSNVKKDVFDLYKKSDPLLKEYITNNGEIIDYKANTKFYSNHYNEGENGTTEVSYIPYNKNNYYYYEDVTYLYTKSENGYSLYTGTELSNDETYYTKKIVYKVGDKINSVEEYEKLVDTSKATKDAKNNWYFNSGDKKEISPIVKENNETKTAINLNVSNWNNSEIKEYLGNNGVKTVEMDVDRISIKIDKIWDDDNNKNKKRPTSITVRIKRNGEDLGEEYKAELSEENNWTYTYENLPLVIDGEEVNYTIVEEEVNDYETKITGNQETGFTITNTIIEVENPNTGFKIALTISGLSLMIIFTYRYLNKHKYTMYKL